MSRPPTLSVVVPTHNTCELTLLCVQAILQEAPDAEVVVVDDASTDGTAERVGASFPVVRLLRAEQQSGFTKSVNWGLSEASGRHLLLLNSDTTLQPGVLECLLAAFTEPGLGIAGAQLHYPDGTPQWSGGKEPSLLWLFALASGLARSLSRLPGYRRLRPLRGFHRRTQEAGGLPVEWVTGAALAFRRTTYDALGPLDEDYRFYCQDLDYCMRARRHGWRVEIVSGFRVVHHHGATIKKSPAMLADQQVPLLLWHDLLLWADKHRSATWVRAARATARLGVRLQLLADWIYTRSPLAKASESRDEKRNALRQALRLLQRPSTLASES